MADFLILDDANVAGPSGIELLKTARVISDIDGFDIVSLKAQGVALIPFVPSSMGPVRETYLRTNSSTRAKNRTAASFAALLLAEGVVGASSFAPTIVVGNVPAGDPAVLQPAPFQYIPDPGDGTGIATALAAAAAAGGAWVHIRRGIYDLGLPTSPALPLQVIDTRVTGDGCVSQLLMSTLDRRLFRLSQSLPSSAVPAPELRDVGISFTRAVPGASGVSAIDLDGTIGSTLSNVEVRSLIPITINADESLTSVFRVNGTNSRLINCRGAGIDAGPGSGISIIRLVDDINGIDRCFTTGGNNGIRIEGRECSVLGSSSVGPLANCIEVAGTHTVVSSCSPSLGGGAGIVVESGGGGAIVGNTFRGIVGDGIRVDVGADAVAISANLMDGEVINNLAGPTTVITGNTV